MLIPRRNFVTEWTSFTNLIQVYAVPEAWTRLYIQYKYHIPLYITLWLFNSSPWYRWPIKIDGLPILIAWWIFPWPTVSHNQRVSCLQQPDDTIINHIITININHILIVYFLEESCENRRLHSLGKMSFAPSDPPGDELRAWSVELGRVLKVWNVGNTYDSYDSYGKL